MNPYAYAAAPTHTTMVDASAAEVAAYYHGHDSPYGGYYDFDTSGADPAHGM
jgi:hypothetical protein